MLIIQQGNGKKALSENRGGYVCIPDLHSSESVRIKDSWIDSRNVESMCLATATFSNEIREYLNETSNLYILARCRDVSKAEKNVAKYGEKKATFVFDTIEDLFERDSKDGATFVGAYYLEYEAVEEDVSNVASVVVKRDQVCKASVCNTSVISPVAQRFDFPYRHSVILEVAAGESHKMMNKYCEKTRKNVQHLGIAMNRMISFSILECLK